MTLIERPRSSALLITIGLAAFVVASHLEAAVSAFPHSAALGAVLTAIATAAAVWTVRVARRPSRATLIAGATGAAALFVLWAYTRTVGVPTSGGPRAPVGILDTLTAFDELLLAGFALAALSPQRIPREAWPLLGSVAISASFIALAMGCEPPQVPASGPGSANSVATMAVICHLY